MLRKSKKLKEPITEPVRKLSPWRVMLGVLILAAIVSGSVFGGKYWWQQHKLDETFHPWFASYVDVTATPAYPFQQMGSTPNRDAMLSFVVSDPGNPCTPSWGGAYTLSQADDNLDLNTRIARLQQQGGSVAVSFGGLNNNELAVGCTDPAELANAYKSVIQHYNINTIDLDIEGSDLSNQQVAIRRAQAIAQLQKEYKASGKHLSVWLTLPVTPQGLSEDGTNEVATFLSNHVDLSGINVMTMDYGQSLLSGQSMLAGSESALIQTERQLGILYRRAGMPLNDATLWAELGATPMIGQNDDEKEVFTLADAQGLNSFARSHGLGRMSMWSANRDITCGSNYISVKVVSTSCSGVNQGSQKFAILLSNGFTGNISLSPQLASNSALSQSANTPDNPATSPYSIWSATSAYLEGTKVVWKHNIYEAKWWTQGDQPDDPVLQSWQTPWELIGPVLPGEKPIPQPTLPGGTYPDWTGPSTYNTGQCVLFQGVPYQAKWWSQGASPAAASSNPAGSPWQPLSQAQISAILSGKSSPCK